VKTAVFACIALALAGCGRSISQAPSPPAPPAPPDSVALALDRYDPAALDAISWPTDTARVNRGSVVWRFSCGPCHGPTGLGDGRLTQPGRLSGEPIRPISFATTWRFGSDRDALVKYIWAGNNKRMPHWGLEGLRLRDMDAVAHYIIKELVGRAE
jgi:mono/diheme cytochrome c family protein